MSKADTINDIINRLYVAAADPASWDETLEVLSELFGGAKVGVNHQDFSSQGLSWTVSHGYDLEAIRLHYEVFNTPEKNVGLRALLMATPLEPFTISSFLTPEEFYSNDSINVVLISQNIHHGLLNVVDKEGANTSLLVYRGREPGDFSSEEKDMARLLGVHLRNSARLARSNLLSSLHEEHRMQVPGTRRYGSAMLSVHGRVIDMDLYAEEVLSAASALPNSNGVLLSGVLCDVNSVDFAQFLARAPAMANFFVRIDEMRTLQVKLLPAAFVHTRVYVPTSIKAVAIRLIDLDAGEVSTSRQLFGLTSAESAIAALICEGLAQNEISDRLAISRNTLKTHLKSLYAKTGTKQQGQLAAKLLKVSQ